MTQDDVWWRYQHRVLWADADDPGRWCPVPAAVPMPRPIKEAVLARLSVWFSAALRPKQPDQQPLLPPFAVRLCQLPPRRQPPQTARLHRFPRPVGRHCSTSVQPVPPLQRRCPVPLFEGRCLFAWIVISRSTVFPRSLLWAVPSQTGEAVCPPTASVSSAVPGSPRSPFHGAPEPAASTLPDRLPGHAPLRFAPLVTGRL